MFNVPRNTSKDTAFETNVCSRFILKLTSVLKVVCLRKDIMSETPRSMAFMQ
jgi:hypothetical protein